MERKIFQMTENTESSVNGKFIDGAVISICHNSKLLSSRADGVFVGSCQVCYVDIVRINPRTNIEEYLDGNSPWTSEDNLRRVER
ncbi:MAG TPA: hypothetical protein VK502_03895 [Candidatus Saccharimonadales bacterium]|nr:hypothetical protein [Candidatus Saccharimonadales bacterium]